MKIGLISFYTRYTEYPNRFYLSTMKLAEYLISNGYEVDLLSYDLDNYKNVDINNINEKNYDLIGLSCFSWTEEAVKYLSNMINNKMKDIDIVIGGAQVENINLDEWNNDIFILGEGEASLLKVCRYVEQGKKDITIFTENPNIFTKEYPARMKITEDITYSSPLFSNIVIPDRKYLWYETCRGCDYNCGYCGHKTRNKTAYFDLETIKQEIINIGNLEFEKVFVIDPNFAGNKERAKKILKYFNEYASSTEVSLYLRPEFLDDDMLKALSRANINHIRIGIQTINENVPSWIRSNSFYHINKYLPKLSELGINWRCELITGLPNDTIDGFMNSIDFAESLNPTEYFCYHLTAIPNTPLYNLVNDFNSELWITVDEKSRVFSSNSYTHDELLKMLEIANARTNFYNKKKIRKKEN